ncbi:RAMP superfamily CRISPR-associated protein [Hathewaya histolytica]|uniref:RAMP superfamily CRISPR-associated protein n=1 Tax=Hathewaya histolytica TaxID=1498 RepID=UPI003B6747FF
MSIKDKRYVTIIDAKVKNITPLHIGTDDDELLISQEYNKVYLPATTISGVFRAYIREIYGEYICNDVFGEGKSESKIYVYDSYSDLKSKEVRPSVKIDKHKGSSHNGVKFNREYVGAEHEFNIRFEVLGKDKEEGEKNKEYIYQCLNALNKGQIVLGAYTTSGAGIFSVESIETCSYDFSNIKGLMGYLKRDKKHASKLRKSYIDKGSFVKEVESNFIDFIIKGNLDTPLLVKGQDTLDYKKPDGENIKNAQGDYVIPGTSVKGVIRSQSERILDYFEKMFLKEEIFGTEQEENNSNNEDIKKNNFNGNIIKEKREEDKLPCRIYVSDVVIENPVNKEGETIYHRIKLDKFTGGVMKGALIEEQPILGELAIKIRLKKFREDKLIEGNIKNNAVIGLLSLALRDLCIGDVSLGSGFSIGRGKLRADCMEIKDGDKLISKINFKDKSITNQETLNSYIKTLKSLTENMV